MVDNRALEEIEDEDEEEDQDVRRSCRMVRYVEVQAGRNYAIETTMGKDRDWVFKISRICTKIFVDGQCVDHKCHETPSNYTCEGVKFQSTGQSMFRKFKFADLTFGIFTAAPMSSTY